jgi:hypothetical protein
MQPLLDFLYDYTFDKSLYCEVPADGGALQLSWRAPDPLHWEVRHAISGEAERVPRTELLAYLLTRNAELKVLEQELYAVAASHIVVADQLLAAARSTFGCEQVDEVLRGHERFAQELQRTLRRMLQPRLRLVR